MRFPVRGTIKQEVRHVSLDVVAQKSPSPMAEAVGMQGDRTMRNRSRKEFLETVRELAGRPRRLTDGDREIMALLTPRLRSLLDAYIAVEMDFHSLHEASGLPIRTLNSAFGMIAPSVSAEATARDRRSTPPPRPQGTSVPTTADAN